MQGEQFIISIPSWENVSKEGSKSPDYTLYSLHIVHRARPPAKSKEWIIKKRFSECHDNYKQLDSVVGENCHLPDFPPKTLTSFGNYEPEFIEKRRLLMEQFYRQLPPFAYSAICLREFLGLDNPEVMQSAREIADRVVLLRPPLSAPYPSALPESLALSNGEEVFFHIIFDSVRDCLESMQTLHDALHSMSGLDNRIGLLHARTEERRKQMHQLETLRMELSNCLCDIQVQSRENLFLFLTDVSSVVEAAISWDHNIEQTMLNDHANGLSATDVDDRIRQYHAQAEEVVTRSLSEGSNEAKAAAATLLGKIEQEISIYSIRKQADIVSKLSVVRDYLNASKLAFASSSRSSRFANPAETAEGLETEMFSLVDDVGKLLQGDPGNGVESNPKALLERGGELRKRIDALAKDIRAFKMDLESRTQDESRFSFINRVSDIQENLADLEFNFRSRFEDEGAELLQAALKNQTVNSAKRQHNRVSDDMFQL
eukprot:TRINITY_DN1222_c0_g3_i2.p1 TRINITY_DN1222_c0_g3~~TRINITY_DN1222_c0_g3_i2.p1  ORF type:complete len:487 (+),score=70.29 TRINITY_DN1222_c0_g3_i2:123-1583(+)